MSLIDLNTPPPNHKFSVSVDREETIGERNVRLFKDVAIFLTALAFVILLASYCYATLADPGRSADEKKWAMSFLSAAAGGMIGYLVRK